MHLWIKPYFQRPTPLQRRIILRPVRRAIHRCGRFGHHAHLSHSIPYVNPQRQFCNKAPLLAKLQRVSHLDGDDLLAIRAWPIRMQNVRGNGYLLRDGQMVRDCSLVLEGHAFRSKLTGVGQRQILSFHRRGDIVDLHHLELRTADHNVQALNEARIAWIPIDAIRATIDARPNVARALWRDSLIDGSIQREWILNVAPRDARTRIAHLLCELIYRREGPPLAVHMPG